MSGLTVIKKIGEKIISIATWPFRHSVMLAEMLTDFVKDAPTVKTLCVGLVEQFEAVGPDVVAAIAKDGLNIPADLRAGADLQSLFVYFQNTFLPGIEAAYKDFKKDSAIAAESPAAPATPDAPAPVATSLADIVPA